MRTSGLEYHPQTRVGPFSLEVCALQCSFMQRKEHQRHSLVMTPEHPSVQTHLGSMDSEILKVAEQGYSRECVVAPSILPHI